MYLTWPGHAGPGPGSEADLPLANAAPGRPGTGSHLAISGDSESAVIAIPDPRLNIGPFSTRGLQSPSDPIPILTVPVTVPVPVPVAFPVSNRPSKGSKITKVRLGSRYIFKQLTDESRNLLPCAFAHTIGSSSDVAGQQNFT